MKWTSPINEFIRADFVLEAAHATTHTTIEDALSHRTGLPRHDLIYGQLNDTPSSVVQRMRYLPMTAEPRTTWQYCNLMYAVITDLLETITGQKLETILADNFWKPLGMSSTTFTLPSAMSDSSRLARGYYWDPPASRHRTATSQGQYVPEPYVDISPISGAGATISTVNDYALWVKALLDATDAGEPRNTSSPITPSILRDLMTPRAIVSDFDNEQEANNSGFITPPLYALGWAITKVAGETLVGHNGGLTGFGADVYMLPDKSYGIISMANTALTSNVAGSIIASRLLQQKLNLSAAHTASILPIQESLLGISKATLHPSVARNHRQTSSSTPQNPMLQTRVLPLPGSIADFAGLYSHPAYGPINLTVATASQNPSSPPEKILEGLFYPRTWPQKLQLSHLTDTVFAVKFLGPHGLGDIVSGQDIVWEDDEVDFQAVFKFGLDGEVVETMGIEIEESMVEMARERGVKHWKEGMLWFEKM